MILIYLGANSTLYAISFFLPSIIEALGYASAQYSPSLPPSPFLFDCQLIRRAQLMSVPPYICACIMVIGSAFISDKFKCRGYINAFNYFVAAMGFVVLEVANSAGARYAGTFLAAMGAFPGIAITIAWNSNNIRGSPTKRAVGIALQSSVGSFGGIIGSFV